MTAPAVDTGDLFTSVVPTFGRPEFDRLTQVTTEIAQKHRALASLAVAEKQGKTSHYFQSQESSVAARDRDSQFQVLNITTDIIRLKGEIDALNVEYQTLLAWMEFQSLRG